MARRAKRLPPLHPGAILLRDFIEPAGITPYRVAKGCNVNPSRIYELTKGLVNVTPDLALRLGLFFGAEPQWFMNLQAAYELDRARATGLGERLAREVKPLAA